jgi:hypothetical protein
MPVILPTQEAQIKRIEVRGQLCQIVLEPSISKKNPATRKGWQSGSNGKAPA